MYATSSGSLNSIIPFCKSSFERFVADISYLTSWFSFTIVFSSVKLWANLTLSTVSSILNSIEFELTASSKSSAIAVAIIVISFNSPPALAESLNVNSLTSSIPNVGITNSIFPCSATVVIPSSFKASLITKLLSTGIVTTTFCAEVFPVFFTSTL